VVAEVLYLVEDVRGEEHGRTPGSDLAAQQPELVLYEWVQTRRRFVEHEDLGLVHERLDYGQLLAVAA
jgi:hypothetical protein